MSTFCTECGNALQEQEQFCSSCGTKYEIPAQQTEAYNEEIPILTRAPKKPMSVLQKILLSLLLTLCIVAIGGHFFIKSLTNADKIVQPIFNAFMDNDEKELFSKLTLPTNVEYDATSYISYIKEQNMDHFLQTLSNSAREVQKDGITRVLLHEDGSELFRIKEGKFLFFYPVIEIITISSNVQLETDLTDVTFIFNKKEFLLNGENIEIGTFLPGNYTVSAASETELIPQAAEWSFFVSTLEKTNEVSLVSERTMIFLDGEQLDSTVFINGIATEKTIEELKQIGPFLGEESIALYTEKKMPTGEIARSHEEVGVGGAEIYFTYPSDVSFIVKTPEEIGEENFDRYRLEQFVLNFRDRYEIGLNHKSFSSFSNYLAPESEAYKELEQFTSEIGDEYYDYNFTFNEVTDINLSSNDAFVSTYEEFYFTNHKNETIFYQRNKQYDVRVNEHGDYEIHKIHIFETKKN